MKKLILLALLLKLLGANPAVAIINEASNIQLETNQRDIGSTLILDISSSILFCNNPRLVGVEVTETVTPRQPFGPVQHLDITLVDNNPLEQPFCDVVGDARFEIPVAVLKAPIITTTVTLRDQVSGDDGDVVEQTTDLMSPTLRLDRPLRSVTVPTNPTTLDNVTVLTHSSRPTRVSRNDSASRVNVSSGSNGSEEQSWRIQHVETGLLPAGYAIERFTRLDTEAYFDLVDAGLASEPGGAPKFSVDSQEFSVVEHRVPVAASGSWYNPANTGRGLSLQVIDETRLIAYWYRFDSTGNPAWLVGEGRVLPPSDQIPGVLVAFNVFLSDGPAGQGDPILSPWGTWEMHFSACGRADFSWTSELANFDSGSEPIEQLAGIGGQDCVTRRRSPLNDDALKR